MKTFPGRYFIALLLLFQSVFALAQDDPDVIKNLAEKTWGVASSCKVNDNEGVFQIALTDSTFELVALDNKMKVLWRNQYKGYAVACGKFKDNILAISDARYSTGSGLFSWETGSLNTYQAFLVDPQSGKTIAQKEILKREAKHKEIAIASFWNDGSDFSLIVRDADIHEQSLFYTHLRDSTEDLTIVNLNEKLDPSYLKPHFPHETFISMRSNLQGDLFMLTTNGGSNLLARRFEHGSVEPSSPILLICDTLNGYDAGRGYNAITPSLEDRNILYLAIFHNNHDGDRELYMGKFDFTSTMAQSATEVFTGKNIRAIESSFEPLNAQFDKPNIGSQKKDLGVRYFQERNGKLIVVASEYFETKVTYTTTKIGIISTGYTVTTWYEKALIINSYDNNLKKQFQTLMPVYYEGKVPSATGYSFHENVLKVISNNQTDGIIYPAYGELDLATGHWSNLLLLNANGKYASDSHIIWFTNSFIVPSNRIHGMFTNKYNIDLYHYNN